MGQRRSAIVLLTRAFQAASFRWHPLHPRCGDPSHASRPRGCSQRLAEPDRRRNSATSSRQQAQLQGRAKNTHLWSDLRAGRSPQRASLSQGPRALAPRIVHGPSPSSRSARAQNLAARATLTGSSTFDWIPAMRTKNKKLPILVHRQKATNVERTTNPGAGNS